MKKKCRILFILLLSSILLKAQNILEVENILELGIYKPDSSAIRNNIKTIHIYYKENRKLYTLIRKTDFDDKGKIKKLINYNYLSPKDSFTITVINNNRNTFDVQTETNGSPFNKIYSERFDLVFQWPDYQSIIAISDKANFYVIRKLYNFNDDSVINVSVFVNNKNISHDFFYSLFQNTDNNQNFFDRMKCDSSFNKDSLIKKCQFKNEEGSSVILRTFYFKNKVVKEESLIYEKGTIPRQNISIWEYDKIGRLVYFEQFRQDIEKLVSLVVKRIIYNKDGTRIETEDKNPKDGNIDLCRKYDSKNNLLSWIKSQYYFSELSKSPNITEIKYEYNSKGLVVRESTIVNGSLKNTKQYMYNYYR